MATCTPGPWQYDPSTRLITAPDGTRVALILTEVDPDIVKGNSRLSDQAPALFEVLGEAQELGAFLLAERTWSFQTEEFIRIVVDRINTAMSRAS